MLYGTTKKTQQFKVKFLGYINVNFWMYKCYTQEKIPLVEANYIHYLKIEITSFTITLF